MILTFSLLCLGVTVGLQEATYAVDEGLPLSVCAEVQSGVLHRAVNFEISFSPLNAQGQSIMRISIKFHCVTLQLELTTQPIR